MSPESQVEFSSVGSLRKPPTHPGRVKPAPDNHMAKGTSHCCGRTSCKDYVLPFRSFSLPGGVIQVTGTESGRIQIYLQVSLKYGSRKNPLIMSHKYPYIYFQDSPLIRGHGVQLWLLPRKWKNDEQHREVPKLSRKYVESCLLHPTVTQLHICLPKVKDTVVRAGLDPNHL